MSVNPILDGLNIVDKYGTQLGSLRLNFRYPLFEPWVWPWAMGADFIMTILVSLAGMALALLDLIVRQDLFIGALGRIYQAGLHQVYAVVSPLTLGTIATIIVMFRIWTGLRPETNSDGRIVRMRIEDRSFYDQYHSNNSMVKQMLRQLGGAVVMLGIIAMLMANPFYLMKTLFSLVAELSSSLTGGDSSKGSTVSVDSVIEPLLQLVNYKSRLSEACNQQWSLALAANKSTQNLSCLTGDQHAATTPDVITMFTSLAAIFVLAGLCWYAWWVFAKGSWFYVKVMWHLAEIPWRGAGMLFRPGDERHKLTGLWEHLKDAIGAASWLIGAIFLAVAGPGLIMTGAAGLGSHGLPAFWQLLFVSFVYGGAGYLVWKYFGKHLSLVRDPKTKKMRLQIGQVDAKGNPVMTGTTGWKDFWQNNTRFNDIRGRVAEFVPSSARGAEEVAGAAGSTQTGGESMTPEEERAIDHATSVVHLGTVPSATVLPVLVSGGADGGQPPQLSIAGASPLALPAGPSGPVLAPGAAPIPALAAGQTAGQLIAPGAAAAIAAGTVAALDGGRHQRGDQTATRGGAAAGTELVVAGGDAGAGGQVLDPDQVLTADEIAQQQVRAYRARVRDMGGLGEPRGSQEMFESTDEAMAAVEAALATARLSVAAWGQLDEVTAAALRRHQQVLDEAARATGPVGPGDGGGFLARQQLLTQWAELQMLARVLGVDLDIADAGPVNDAYDVFFEGSDNPLDNRIEFGRGKGFGDHI